MMLAKLIACLLLVAATSRADDQVGAKILKGKTARGPMSALVADPQTVMAFEVLVGAVTVAFIFFFLLGSRANLQIARTVSAFLSDALSEQFAQIGTNDGKALVKDGQACYWFYATGRKHTLGMTVLMDLAKRMDVFSYTSGFFSRPQRDRIVIFLPISPDVTMDPMSLFVVRKRELSRLREIEEGAAVEAVESLAAEVVSVSGLPSDFVTMAEHKDIVSSLLPEKMKTLISNNSKFVTSIHVTEQGAKWEPQCRLSKRLVRVEFVLPTQNDHRERILFEMSQVALHLLDVSAEGRISAVARKKAMELRKRVTNQIEKRVQKARAEAAAEKRLEKKKAEEEAVGQMSRERQAKHEEKKRKKEIAAKLRRAAKK